MLLRHVQDAIKDKFIKLLVDEYANLLNKDIPTILEYLFYNYGKVHSEEVAQKEAKVITMTWQPIDSIVFLTHLLEQL